MNKGEILQYFGKHYENRYIVYVSSIKSDKNNSFFIVKDNNKKYLLVIAGTDMAQKFEGNILENKKINKNEPIIKLCSLKLK